MPALFDKKNSAVRGNSSLYKWRLHANPWSQNAGNLDKPLAGIMTVCEYQWTASCCLHSWVILRELRMGKRESVGGLYSVQAILITVVVVSIAGGSYFVSQLYQDQVELRADVKQQKSELVIHKEKIAQLQQKFHEIIQKVWQVTEWQLLSDTIGWFLGSYCVSEFLDCACDTL